MTKHFLLFCALLAPAAALAQPSTPPQVVVRGTVTTGNGEHPAWFTLICTQGNGGALSMQLMLGTESAADFPFDAFEGPHAPASSEASATLKVGHQSFSPTAVAGWYSGDVNGAFVFGIASAPGSHATINRVAAALDQPGITLRWIQLGNTIQTPPLVAQFTLDAAQALALKQVAAPCLPRTPRR